MTIVSPENVCEHLIDRKQRDSGRLYLTLRGSLVREKRVFEETICEMSAGAKLPRGLRFPLMAWLGTHVGQCQVHQSTVSLNILSYALL